MEVFDSAAGFRKPRDLLPLPLVLGELAPSPNLSRAVRRRLERRAHWQSWLQEGITALNEMGHEGHKPPSAPAVPSAAQQMALHHITEAYRRTAGAAAQDETRTGALCALCAQPFAYGDSKAKMESYKPERVSWPPSGASAVELSKLLAPEDVTWYEDWQSHVLRPRDEAFAAQRRNDVRPHVDPALRGPIVYANFVKEMLDRGLVKLIDASTTVGEVGVFFVPKKHNGRFVPQRLIIDTRSCNTWFREPPRTPLPSPAAIGRIELECDAPLHFAAGA